MSGPPFHIKAEKEDIAENVIAVGDPGRAKMLAELLDDARLVNEHRGFLIYTGTYKGKEITIATHGIGCPSAAIVFEELGMLGAKRIVRLGTTGGMKPEMEIGDVVVATGAVYPPGGCGVGMYLDGHCGPTAPDPVLSTRIMDELDKEGIKYYYGPVFSSDAFYAEDPGFAKKWSEKGVIAVEMEAAILFTLGWMRSWSTAAVLIVSDNLLAEKQYLATSEELRARIERVAKAIMDVYVKYY